MRCERIGGCAVMMMHDSVLVMMLLHCTRTGLNEVAWYVSIVLSIEKKKLFTFQSTFQSLLCK
jgi:hypothetical protein